MDAVVKKPTGRRPWWEIFSPRSPFKGEEGLTRKVTLALGFMSFIPLLLIVWAFLAFAFPNLHTSDKNSLQLFVVAIIVSIFVGYSVLKRTMGAILDVVKDARAMTWRHLGQPAVTRQGDEVMELARTFQRITHELEQKVEALESSRALIKRLLSRIGTAIVSYQDIDNILELIVENASAALEAQMGSLLLVDGEQRDLEVKVRWSESGQSLSIHRMKLGEGIAGWVAKEHAPMRGTGTPAAIGLSNGRVGEGSVLCVPLTIREKTIGALSVLRSNVTHPFTEDDQTLLASIGSQVAVAIENYRLNLDIEHTYLETVMALALAVEAKESYTAGHSKRVGFYAAKIGEAMGLDEETGKLLHESGMLHDVGKIGIRDDILLKPAELTSEEERVMQQHPIMGEAILKPLRSLGKVSELIRCHHEHYDGSGYPNGLKGEEIPLEARIIVVADSYDSMVTDRPYRKRLTFEEAKDQLLQGRGTQFDPQVVDVFLALLAEKDQRLVLPAGS